MASVGAEIIAHHDLDEALSHLRAQLLPRPTQRELIGFYWAGLDHVAHIAGPGSAAFDQATCAFWAAMDQALAGVDTRDTTILFTADHGHIGANATDTLYINHRWPELKACLAESPTGQTIWPNGSPRDMFLHIRPERRSEVLALLDQGLRGIAEVLTVDDALSHGLFGHGRVHPELRRRLGDILVLPHLGHFIWWHEPGLLANQFNGHHGGLTREELTTVVGLYR